MVQAYAANTWYHVKYGVNTLTRTLDVYVNGAPKKTGMAFGEGATTVSNVQFFSGAPPAPSTSTMLSCARAVASQEMPPFALRTWPTGRGRSAVTRLSVPYVRFGRGH